MNHPMSNDTPTPQDEQPAAPDFNAIPWQVLIGIRATTDPSRPHQHIAGLEVQMAAAADVMVDTPAGRRPDKTIESVHFAQWFDRNKEHLVALWRTEYTQYMNLRRLTEREKPAIPGLKIVAPDGSSLQ